MADAVEATTTPTAPVIAPETPAPAPESTPAPVSEPAPTDAPTAPPSEDDIYAAAFEEHLSPATPKQPEVSEPSPAPSSLTDPQQQLLKRAHVTPEMAAAWTVPQRDEFLKNAAQRETDQARGFGDLKQQLQDLAEAAQKQGQPPPEQAAEVTPPAGTEAEAAAPASENGQPPTELNEQARQVVDTLVETFGEQMKPLGDVFNQYEQQIQGLTRQVGSVPVMESVLANLVVDRAISQLTSDYPSLNAPETRKQVEQRFEADWPNSPHRLNQELPYPDRIASAMRDAAAGVFGNVTESAAQVALAQSTKEHLLAQPPVGQGAPRAKAKTEDDVYADAFEKHLRPEIGR